ncbi:tetratricopeptide repeat protein 23 isoform X4 [Heterocephalus glaber]|uniref:Tetratricopeptide repeat protein 23 isoform X4 n=2 Tax=Heterocephalus glaber TaxID=10181 RepID=A0AAX6TDI8_HETGA|nr:tetratricopeptide repeat protein 23 isoform X4 [Heterocephalus glaber]
MTVTPVAERSLCARQRSKICAQMTMFQSQQQSHDTEDNEYKNMQESQETHISNHLDEVVAAVSINPRKKIQNKLPQTVLFQPPREKLHLCEEKAKSCFSSHQYKQGIHELSRCIALTRICYGDSHWKLAEAHISLAQGYLLMKGFSLQAKQHAEKAKEILTDFIVPPYDDNTDVFKCSVELFHTLGRAFLSLQKFKEASENLVKAERLSRELLQCGRIVKEEWIEVQARIKLSFAQVYHSQKKSQEALPHYQEALEYVEISKGEESPEYVSILRELAGAEQALGFHNTAINHFLQAHVIILGRSPSQEEAADSAQLVARAAVASRRPEHHDVAEKYFQESMAHFKNAEGAGNTKFLAIQDEFCHFLQITGQKERATLILKESLEAKVEAFGYFSLEVAETYKLVGGADLAQGNHSGAHKNLKKCLQIQSLLYGPQNKKTVATQQSVDILSRAREGTTKPRQSPKAKVAFCTSASQRPSAPRKGRPNLAD